MYIFCATTKIKWTDKKGLIYVEVDTLCCFSLNVRSLRQGDKSIPEKTNTTSPVMTHFLTKITQTFLGAVHN